MRNHLTKFKAIDFISDTFHTYITTLSQQLQEHISTNSHSNYSDRSSTTLLITNFHNIMQELVKIIHHILSQHTSSTTNINIILCDRSSTNLSQHYHKLFIEYFNKFQQVSTRWMSIDFLLQLIQQTMVQFFNNIHFNRSWYNSLSILQQHTSSTIYISFLNISSSYLQQTFNELLQSILRNILHNKLVMYYFNKHSTNIFEKRPSKHSFQQTMIHFYITNIHNRRVGYRTSSHLHHD